MEKSTVEASSKSNPTTSQVSSNVIFSEEFWAGPSPSNSPGGQKIDPSGPPPCRASRLAALEKDWLRLTSATSGLISETSSQSAALQSSLANKLRAHLPAAGSPEYVLTWKEQPLPSGPPICALRASVPRTGGKGSTGWRTPATSDAKRGAHPNPDQKAGSHSLNTEAALTPWPTPNTPSGGPNSKREQRGAGGMDLEEAASLAPWPTPNTMGGGQTSRGGDRKDELLMGGLVAWPTPRAEDSESTGAHHGKPDTLNAAAKMVSPWVTPSSRDWKDTPGMSETGVNPDGSTQERLDQLPRQAQLTHGPITPSSSAETEKQGVLNPAFPRWLQGYPKAWCIAAILAHRSMPRRKRAG